MFNHNKMENIEGLYKESLKLRPAERLQLMEMIAKNLDQPNEVIDQSWANEAEKRYYAMKKKDVKTISLNEIIARYK